MNQLYKEYLQNSRKNKITEHFTVFEIVNSSTAIAKNIDNRPTTQVLYNATLLIKNVLEKVRIHFNKPVIIHSFYRSPNLNHAIGGVATSQHIKGQAADFTVKNYSIDEVFNYVKNNLIFDQVILETSNNAKWVHVSFNAINNRHQSLIYKNGKYING